MNAGTGIEAGGGGRVGGEEANAQIKEENTGINVIRNRHSDTCISYFIWTSDRYSTLCNNSYFRNTTAL